MFGARPQAVEQAVEALPKEWQVRAQRMTRGGETLLMLDALDVTAENAENAENVTARLKRAQSCIEASCAAAVYGQGEQTLPQAVVRVMLEKDKLLVCGDAATGALLEPRLEAVEGAERVFDFGSQSYLHPKNAQKISEAGQRTAMKHPQDELQIELSCMQAARHVTEADLTAGCVSCEGGMVLLVGTQKGIWVRAVPETEKPALWLLDMLRRAASGVEQTDETHWIRWGAIVPEEWQTLTHTQSESDPTMISTQATPWVAQRGEHPPTMEPTAEAEKAKPRKRKHHVFGWLLLVVLLLACASMWYYTGGDWDALRKNFGWYEFTTSGASLL